MWIEKNNKLTRSFTFSDFSSAIGFVVEAAILSESVQHHPRIINEFNRVEIELCTHDAGDVVTEKDHLLASEIDRIYLPFMGKMPGKFL